jgi:hypothetical protein
MVLLVATGFVALLSEFLVGTIENVRATFGITETFVGVIIIAIIGNALSSVSCFLSAGSCRALVLQPLTCCDHLNRVYVTQNPLGISKPDRPKGPPKKLQCRNCWDPNLPLQCVDQLSVGTAKSPVVPLMP